MASSMKWSEIQNTYPDEWVAVINFNTDEKGFIEGEVVAHSADKDEFYREAGDLLPVYKTVAMRYTGECIKNPEVPLLWQITHSER